MSNIKAHSSFDFRDQFRLVSFGIHENEHRINLINNWFGSFSTFIEIELNENEPTLEIFTDNFRIYLRPIHIGHSYKYTKYTLTV